MFVFVPCQIYAMRVAGKFAFWIERHGVSGLWSTIVYLAIVFSLFTLLLVLFYTLPFPAAVFGGADYRLPDDGLDDFTRKVVKFQCVFIAYCIGAGVLYCV